MKTLNSLLIQESNILYNSYMQEVKLRDKDNEKFHHEYLLTQYENLEKCLYANSGYEGLTREGFFAYMLNAKLNGEQVENIILLRNHPLFKKALGEYASKKKKDVEQLLAIAINNEGKAYCGEYGVTKAVKIEVEIQEEATIINQKLKDLLDTGNITEDDYQEMTQILYYLFNYYISQANGEQLPYDLITDKEYKHLLLNAKRNNTTFAQELTEERLRRRFLFEDAQTEQENDYITRKGNTK